MLAKYYMLKGADLMKRGICTLLLISIIFSITTITSKAISISSSNSTIEDGSYVISIKDSTAPVRAKVVFENNTYLYDLNEGQNLLPLQFGNGTYSISVYENVHDSLYKKVGFKEITVDNNNNPFLSNNLIVDNSFSIDTIETVKELIDESLTDEEKISIIYQYVVESLSYDYTKDIIGINTNIDNIFADGKASVFDYALGMTILLRANGIPAKFVIGNHIDCNNDLAWVEVFVNGEYKIINPAYEREDIYQDINRYEQQKFW